MWERAERALLVREDSEEDDLPGMKMTEKKEEMKIFVMFTNFYDKYLSSFFMKFCPFIH